MSPQRAQPLSEKGVTDFERVLEIQSPLFQKLRTHPRGELLFGLVNGWYRLGNEGKASTYYERVVGELAGTEYEKRASIWLDTKKLAADQMGYIGCHVR